MKKIINSALYTTVFSTFSFLLSGQPFPAFITHINQIDFEQPVQFPNSNFGEIGLEYVNPLTDELLYFNLLYFPPGGGTDLIWSIQNLPLPPNPEPSRVSTWFDLDPLHVLPGGTVIDFALVFPIVTPTPLLEMPAPLTPVEVIVGQQIYRTGDNGILPQTHLPPVLTVLPEITWPVTLPPDIDFKFRLDMPNIDLDSTSHPPIAGYAGDYNACVPAATANSFSWLRKKTPLLDSLLRDTFGMGEDSLRKMLMEFSQHMNQADTQGVFLPEMVMGKLAFIDKYKLPVSVKFQAVASINPGIDIPSPNPQYGHLADNQTTPDTMGPSTEAVSRAWLFNELCEDEDVEMQYHCCWFLNGVHQPELCYAHSTVLSGASRIGDQYTVFWNDDQDQVKAGGTRDDFMSGITVNTQNGKDYLVLRALSDTVRINDDSAYTQRCFIESAVSESFDPTVTFVPEAVWTPTGPGLPDLTLIPNPLHANETLMLQVTLPSVHPVVYQLYDAAGRILTSGIFHPIQAGVNQFHLKNLDLLPGIFTIRLFQDGLQTSSLFVMVK